MNSSDWHSNSAIASLRDGDLPGLLVRTMAEGLIAVDVNGKVLTCNPAASRMLGLTGSPEGLPIIDLLRQAVREDGSGFPATELPVALTLRTAESAVGTVMGFHRCDGSLLWVQANCQAVLDADGRVDGAMLTFADVTAIMSREKALRDAEGRWRLAIEGSEQGVWDCEIASERVQFSRRALRQIGLPEGVPAHPLADWMGLVHAEDARRLEQELRAYWDNGNGRFRSEFRVLATDGSGYRDLIARGGIVARDDAGNPSRMIGTLADVTLVRDAQAAASEGELRFMRLADATPMPIWVSNADRRRIYFNAAWCDLTGQSADDAVQGSWLDAIHPEDRAGAEANCARAVLTEAPFTSEYRLRCCDGSYRRVIEQATPRHDDRGKLMGYVGLCVDIEERYRAEREIAKLSRALEQAALSIVITDGQGVIEYANPTCCLRYGYHLRELVGSRPSIFKSGRTPPEVYQELWSTIEQGLDWTGVLCNRRRDGSEIWESVSISPVRDEQGRTTHFVALKEDITEKLQAEDRERDLARRMYRLERMQAMSTLVGGVAHDFNNILVAILGFSELGELQLKNGQPAHRVAGYLAEIRTAGERARGLVKQLLAAGRAGPISLVELSVAALAEDMQAILSVSMPNHPVKVEAALDVPSVRADADQIHQVLLNLLLNARDAMPDGGEIELTIDATELAEDLECEICHEAFFGKHLRISVRDQGAGIPPPVRKHLFEPFFTTKDVGKGTGLGLPVVDGIVHRHGGHLCVHTEAGSGTRFEIFLPLPNPRPAQ